MAPNFEILDIDVHENRMKNVAAKICDISVETNSEILVQTEKFHLYHWVSLMRQQINENKIKTINGYNLYALISQQKKIFLSLSWHRKASSPNTTFCIPLL